MKSAALPRRLATLSAALATVAAVLTVGAATAGASTTASAACSDVVENPFLRWADPLAYTLLTGGDFEGRTTSWKLANGAKLASGNEPFKVHKATDSKSLAIPAGGSATSPPFCVSLAHPTLRLFAVGGNATSLLRIDVIYNTVLGTVTQPVTLVPVMGTWGPTLQTAFLANVTGLLSLDGLTSSVQFRFTALGKAGWTIDDVYVDPWKVK